jgi:hypothetical protein
LCCVRLNSIGEPIYYSDTKPLIDEMAAAGKSLRVIAAALNESGHTTRTGKPWSSMQVRRVLRLEALPLQQPLPFELPHEDD